MVPIDSWFWAPPLYMMVAGTGSVYLLVAALKPIASEFDWPRTVPSIAYALQYLGGGLGGILMGHWLDKAGMAKPLCWVPVCWVQGHASRTK